MKIDRFVKFLLLVIAVSLAGLALRPYVAPPVVEAQSGDGYPFYIEPGTAMLRAPDGSRHVLGKVVVDMRNGNVWGFPTMARSLPRRRNSNHSANITSVFAGQVQDPLLSE